MIASKSDHSEAANPFRPGMGLDPPYLADRAAQLERFTRYLAAFPAFPRNVRLTGLRGVGKTVLLQHYAAAAEARGWVVVRRECSEHLRSESTFALALVADCRTAVEHSSRALALRQRSTTAARRALDLLGGLTVTLEGVTLAIKPPASAARQPEVLEDRMFQAELLDALRPPEDALAFVRPFESSDRGIDPEVVESVRDDTGGYPFHIQFFGASLWEACMPSPRIAYSDFVRHRPAILRALDGAFFDARLARTSGLERRVLRAVAGSGENAALHVVRASLNLPNHRIQPVIADLEAKGLLYRPERGRLAFTVPLFGDYLRRR